MILVPHFINWIIASHFLMCTFPSPQMSWELHLIPKRHNAPSSIFEKTIHGSLWHFARYSKLSLHSSCSHILLHILVIKIDRIAATYRMPFLLSAAVSGHFLKYCAFCLHFFGSGPLDHVSNPLLCCKIPPVAKQMSFRIIQ